MDKISEGEDPQRPLLMGILNIASTMPRTTLWKIFSEFFLD
jgi:hypothetical protein